MIPPAKTSVDASGQVSGIHVAALLSNLVGHGAQGAEQFRGWSVGGLIAYAIHRAWRMELQQFGMD